MKKIKINVKCAIDNVDVGKIFSLTRKSRENESTKILHELYAVFLFPSLLHC